MLYFAYGSCMNPVDFARTCPSAKMVCADAVLPGYQLVFDGYSAARQGGVANIRCATRHAVHGVLWDVPKQDWRALDRREGAPHVYRRVPVTVVADGEVHFATTYMLVRPLPFEVAPSDTYARLILDAIENPAYRRRIKRHIEMLREQERMMCCV